MPSPPKQEQIVRASAALTAAYVAGTALDAMNVERVAFFCTYNRHASATVGAVVFKVELSPDGGTTYYQTSLVESGVVSIGSDVTSDIQREEYMYQATSTIDETFTLFVDTTMATNILLSAKEVGDVVNLGTFAVTAMMK